METLKRDRAMGLAPKPGPPTELIPKPVSKRISLGRDSTVQEECELDSSPPPDTNSVSGGGLGVRSTEREEKLRKLSLEWESMFDWFLIYRIQCEKLLLLIKTRKQRGLCSGVADDISKERDGLQIVCPACLGNDTSLSSPKNVTVVHLDHVETLSVKQHSCNTCGRQFGDNPLLYGCFFDTSSSNVWVSVAVLEWYYQISQRNGRVSLQSFFETIQVGSFCQIVKCVA